MFGWFKRQVNAGKISPGVDEAITNTPILNPNLRNGMWVVSPDGRVGILTDVAVGEVTHTDAAGNNVMEIKDNHMVVKKSYHTPMTLRQARISEIPATRVGNARDVGYQE